ncbi:MAG: pyruvate dehydrogenase (acetyl-transferring) E1 component subunit alpha [Bacillota bacterium]
MELSKGQLLRMYEDMVNIRRFEEKAIEFFTQSLIRGSMHLYIGEEAVAVGVCHALRQDDYIVSTHRGHGHCLAKGADVNRTMAELLGKATGYCKGKGGSMHIADLDTGNLGANGIVAAGIPIAVGAALSAQYRGTDQVAVAFFGDGATNQGVFHEAMNLAAIWKLPVIFVCENNLYGITVPAREAVAVTDIADRAQAYNIPGVIVDGNDVRAVYEAACQAVARARAGKGPILLECKTYRHEGHYKGDPCVYRTDEEVRQWKERDPIKHLGKVLVEEGIATQAELEHIHMKVEQAIEAASAFALESPEPSPEELFQDVFAS